MARAKPKHLNNPPLVPKASSLKIVAGNKHADLKESQNLKVSDNWPELVPITRNELELLELYLGSLIDETLR